MDKLSITKLYSSIRTQSKIAHIRDLTGNLKSKLSKVGADAEVIQSTATAFNQIDTLSSKSNEIIRTLEKSATKMAATEVRDYLMISLDYLVKNLIESITPSSSSEPDPRRRSETIVKALVTFSEAVNTTLSSISANASALSIKDIKISLETLSKAAVFAVDQLSKLSNPKLTNNTVLHMVIDKTVKNLITVLSTFIIDADKAVATAKSTPAGKTNPATEYRNSMSDIKPVEPPVSPSPEQKSPQDEPPEPSSFGHS